jgi:hypothetical protein
MPGATSGAEYPDYIAQAPSGEFRKVPGNYIRLRIDTAVAKSMIDLIKLGRSLPTEFVAKLPIIVRAGPYWLWGVAAKPRCCCVITGTAHRVASLAALKIRKTLDE